MTNVVPLATAFMQKQL